MKEMTVSDCDLEFEENLTLNTKIKIWGKTNRFLCQTYFTLTMSHSWVKWCNLFCMEQMQRLTRTCKCITALELLVLMYVRSDSMEQMSFDNSDLPKLINVLASLSQNSKHKVIIKSVDDIINIFWKEFNHFTYKTSPLFS